METKVNSAGEQQPMDEKGRYTFKHFGKQEEEPPFYASLYPPKLERIVKSDKRDFLVYESPFGNKNLETLKESDLENIKKVFIDKDLDAFKELMDQYEGHLSRGDDLEKIRIGIIVEMAHKAGFPIRDVLGEEIPYEYSSKIGFYIPTHSAPKSFFQDIDEYNEWVLVKHQKDIEAEEKRKKWEEEEKAERKAKILRREELSKKENKTDEEILELLDDEPLYNNFSKSESKGGYHGQSKSNRAILAEKNNQFPISKWNKEHIKKLYDDSRFSFSDIEELDELLYNEIMKLSNDEIRQNLLERASWHHTGKFANFTNYFGLKSPREIYNYLMEKKKK